MTVSFLLTSWKKRATFFLLHTDIQMYRKWSVAICKMIFKWFWVQKFGLKFNRLNRRFTNKQCVFQIDSSSYYSNCCKLTTNLHNITTHVTRYPNQCRTLHLFTELVNDASIKCAMNMQSIFIDGLSKVKQRNEWLFKWDHRLRYLAILIYSFQLR